jgi:hypothetical protein
MDETITAPIEVSEVERLRKEVSRLRARIDELEREADTRDRDLREGLLMIIRGTERRLGIGKYANGDGV